ncbi:hypothetical protein, partial [Capnocytophaga canimorsus]|uniref:hypothetical protein n=1 Tax=Capnocytophaga canimorsus TaxID=28188 RepID=UPI001BB3CA15
RTAAFFKLKLQSFVIGVFCFSNERRCSQARVTAFFKEKADSKRISLFFVFKILILKYRYKKNRYYG